ncbi:hypothetical protein EWM64_g8083 [Hericium alpestre]|uniref:Uncharacterized protein n=1 Tax=Hericium alpestre TaxID=135208 RepID=A0A4Y9ZNU4_9AGAM|nr:hypothetical protein EWM64_g8083 [Hericium alpestre]
MCISLACYSAQEMASTRASMGNPDAWEPVLKGCHPSAWPAHGILYANVNDKISLLLSKPMKVVDNLVDISYLMQEGQNTLQISHDQDTTDYVFFLIAHQPVRAQLKELASVRQEEVAWAQHIENSTKPLQSVIKVWEHFMVY